jgi:hypothetical protein
MSGVAKGGITPPSNFFAPRLLMKNAIKIEFAPLILYPPIGIPALEIFSWLRP